MARKAELRLDTRSGQVDEREGRRPVVPGNAAASELIRRIESDDKKLVMPPPSSGLSLNSEERALLRRWIDEGAPFEEHWAFVPVVAPAVPATSAGARVRNEVDAFVQDKLDRAGIEAAASADPATLLRRVHLDLTGLPPTPEEVDAFLADPSDAAYEGHVDRLLESRQHGERMALMWLDAARYADTNGFHHDNIRTSWPYRDWVIRAFAKNLPYDRFVTEQIAGDLLDAPTTDQRIATAFARMHNINDEGGALDAEYKVEAVCDRIETIATTFLGLTLTCARCHDHKYDPLTQEDYYSIYAIFNSVDERGVYPNNNEQARAYPARLSFYPDDLAARIDTAKQRVAHAQQALREAEPGFVAERERHEADLVQRHGIAWLERASMTLTSEQGVHFTRQDDESWFFDASAAARVPEKDVQRFQLETRETGLRLVRFEALPDERLPGKSLGTVSHGNAVVSRFRLEVESLADPTRREFVPLAFAWADHEQQNEDFDILNTLDDPAWAKRSEGWALAGHQDKARRTAVLVASRPFGFEGGSRLTLHVHYESRYGQHLAGRTRVTFGRARETVVEALPLRHSAWFAAGPFKAANFDEAYATAYGPEAVDHVDTKASFDAGKGKKQAWRYDAKLEADAVYPFTATTSAFYFARELRTPNPARVALYLGSDDAVRVYVDGKEVLAQRVFRGAAKDQDRLEFDVPAGRHAVVVKVVNDAGPGGFYGRIEVLPGANARGRYAPIALVPSTDRDATTNERYAREWASTTSPTFAALDAELVASQQALTKLEGEAVPVLVMQELAAPVPTYVLTRGHYEGADKARPVERRPPLFLGGALPSDAPKNRLGFAKWLVSKENPLTARVHVNRLWQMIFGAGLVATSENFGMQAAWPSHPELLDWLAARFARDWDGRALLRLIVTSEVYRRSARPTGTALERDPKNELLARFPRQRLAGELIRDLALFTSGLLHDQPFGAPVRPYQPPGLWRELSIGASSNTRIFERDMGNNLYRRSLYTFWKRTSPNPQMATFDAPTREYCVVRRSVTNTPLQALVLWNDEQFLEAARVLAQRTCNEVLPQGGDEDAARIDRIFLRCTGRHVTAREQGILSDALASFRERYRASPTDADALLAIGEAPQDPRIQDGSLDHSELAAWMLLANTILSLDETIVRD